MRMEAMIDEIAQYGPVVALGMPGEKKIPFGAMRYYSTHEDWQKIVTETAKQRTGNSHCCGQYARRGVGI